MLGTSTTIASGGQLRLLEVFPKLRILVVGDLVADHYIYGQSERVSREAPVLVVRHESEEVKLGGAANAAANVRSLGGKVAAIGVLGDDQMGNDLRRLFKREGIHLHAVGGAGVETETKTRILAGGVSTTRQQMLRVDRGARGPLPAKVRLELARMISSAAADADAVLVSDYGAGVVADETSAALTKLAREGLTVCADSRYGLKQLAGSTVCKPNEPELEAVSGMPVRSHLEMVAAGRRALELLKCKALVVTRGRNGMALFEGEDMQVISAHGAHEAVDVTGAGDTVIAALTLAVAAGAKLGEAAQFANIAGALVVMKPGTATVTRSELERELLRQR